MKFIRRYWVDAVALIAVAIVFLIPFAFIIVTAVKSRPDAAKLDFTLPQQWRIWGNLHEVLTYRDNMLVTALKNSLLLTVISVTFIVLLSAMVGFVAQRRQGRMVEGSQRHGVLRAHHPAGRGPHDLSSWTRSVCSRR